jgi:hypothetical protein
VALSDYPDRSSRSATWRAHYEAVLQEKDIPALFLRVEAAEAAILTRRAALEEGVAPHKDEPEALAMALTHLRVVKREQLKFG